MKTRLRLARRKDARLLWRWANESQTRRAGYHPAPIPWTSHLAWYRKRLSSNATCRVYILEQGGRPRGQARFERNGRGELVIGISVARGARGRGLGVLLVGLSTPRALSDLCAKKVIAYVRKDNLPSLTVFQRAGYRRVRSLRKHGVPSVLLTWKAGSKREKR